MSKAGAFLFVGLILGAIVLGASLFSGIKLDISAGPKARGEQTLLEAQAESERARAAQEAADDELQRQLDRQKAQAEIDEAEKTTAEIRPTVVKVARFRAWAVGGAAILGAVILFVLIPMLFVQRVGIENFRRLLAPIKMRSGPQVVITSLMHLGRMIFVSDDSPSTLVVVDGNGAPQLAQGDPNAAMAQAFARGRGGLNVAVRLLQAFQQHRERLQLPAPEDDEAPEDEVE